MTASDSDAETCPAEAWEIEKNLQGLKEQEQEKTNEKNKEDDTGKHEMTNEMGAQQAKKRKRYVNNEFWEEFIKRGRFLREKELRSCAF